MVPIRLEDVEKIRIWRNAQIDVLRQNEVISQQSQIQYFEESVWPTFEQANPLQILFSLIYEGDCVGYGGLTRIDWTNRRAEVSFLVNPSRAENDPTYRQDFTYFLKMLCRIAFADLQLQRLIAETYAFRYSTIKTLEEIGFKHEGILRNHVKKQGRWIDSIMLALLSQEWSLLQQKKKSKAVLVTSISGKVPLLHAVRSAAAKIGEFGELHGCDSSSSCIGRYEVDFFWNSPPTEHSGPEEVIAYCKEHQISAIIPTRDGDLHFYAKHRDIFHQAGIIPMVSSLETVQNCSDKFRFAEILLKNDFPAIPSYLSLEQFDSSSYVVKENSGAGSHLIGISLSRDQAEEHAKLLKSPIFQPYISGQEWSIDLYCSLSGSVQGVVARQRNVVVRGESQVTTTRRYPLLERLCSDMARLLNFYGHAVFQVIEDDGGAFHVVECNPRFGGASTASVAVGLDSFFWFFSECLEINLKGIPFNRSAGEIRQVRHAADRILPW